MVYKKNLTSKILSNPRIVFGTLIDNGYNLIHKRNFLFNISVFYPMCAAIILYHKRNILIVVKLTIRKIILFSLRKLSKLPAKDQNEYSFDIIDVPPAEPLLDLTLDSLSSMINNEKIKIVSFDIFDTLLTRPIINDPRDIFYLLAEKINKKYNLDFISIRWDAESMLSDPYANIDDIYAYIEKKYSIPHDTIEDIKEEELNCERRLLKPRVEMLKLCQLAHSYGKRIIATSDMYLPSKFLLDVLHEKGFHHIEKVYVSCEHHARKTDSGALFEIVLNEENSDTSSIIHIGDNQNADVTMPLKKGIAAIHYPSILQRSRKYGGKMFSLLSNMAKEEPLLSMIFGHSLENIFDKPETGITNLDQCLTMKNLGELLIGPFAAILCIKSKEIADKNDYSCIYYASRDGWLPFKIHKALESTLTLPEAVYFQAGRRAYFPFIATSFINYVFDNVPANTETFTMSDLLKSYFAEESLTLLDKLTSDEQNLLCFRSRSQSINTLKKIEKEINTILKHKKECALKYYKSIFSENKDRFLVFDIGYSGSISIALSAITQKKIDKLYCWQSNRNKDFDKKNGTLTFTLMKDQNYSPYNLVLEELFSPPCGGTIGFTSEGLPIQEVFSASHEMIETLESLHTICINYSTDMAKRFFYYINILANIDLDFGIKIFRQWFQERPFINRAIFQSIVFPDPIFFDNIKTLEEKMDIFLNNPRVFSATGFENNGNELYPYTLCEASTNPRLGIHIHIYNPELAQEFIRYLCTINIGFDLFITHTNPIHDSFFKKLFHKEVITNANGIEIRCTPNRGRDVAPWLITTAQVQQNYDLFCHVHAKESTQFARGASWRTYLLDNLLRPEAVRTTIAAFSKNKKLGLTFPKIYLYAQKAMADTNQPFYGACCPKEYDLIIDMLKRMNLQPTYGRSEQFFSVGTMFWYRPKALKPLFTCGLEFEDFPEEPIGIEGTLAHSLERIPPVVCKRLGYEVRSLTLFQEH